MENKPRLYRPRTCPGFHVAPHMFTPRRGQNMCDECVERERKYKEDLASREREKRERAVARQEEGSKKRQEILDKNRSLMAQMRAMRNNGYS